MKTKTDKRNHDWVLVSDRLQDIVDMQELGTCEMESALKCSKPTALKLLRDCSKLTLGKAVELANDAKIAPTSFFKKVSIAKASPSA